MYKKPSAEARYLENSQILEAARRFLGHQTTRCPHPGLKEPHVPAPTLLNYFLI